jgi:translocation and assembly module TamA
LDNFFYPHKGWSFNALFALGNKKIIQNSNFNEQLYPNVQVNSTQYSFTAEIDQYLKIGKRAVLFTRISGGDVANKTNLFYNDLYRLGGLKTIRGFNENFFYASSYLLGNFEYRLFTDPTSYLFLFVDQAWMRNVLSSAIPYDTPTGFGMGVSFTTPAGIFNFVYGLGNSKGQQINVNQSKLSFGVVSRF